jgi:hypothetical protein
LFLGHFGQGLFLLCTVLDAFVNAALGDLQSPLALARGWESPMVIFDDTTCIVLPDALEADTNYLDYDLWQCVE